MKYILLILCSFSVLSHDAKSEDETAKIIMGFDKEWTNAYVKKDIKKLESLMADDFVTTDPSGTTYLNGKEQNIGPVKSGELVYESFNLEKVDVRVHGDTAIAVGRFSMKGKSKGEPFSGRYAYTEAWAKRAGKWQAVAEHITEIKPNVP